jgi:hypothetical protein
MEFVGESVEKIEDEELESALFVIEEPGEEREVEEDQPDPGLP